MTKYFKLVLILLALFGYVSVADAEFSVSRVKPIDYNPKIEKNENYINHNYGEYRGTPGYLYHDGFDYLAVNNMEVHPISSGTAYIYPEPPAKVGKKEGWGNYVIVKHDAGYQTRYAHLSTILVSNEARVDTSTILGLSGNTGNSYGEHLHFSIGSTVDINNTEHPIYAGLKQPKYGTLSILECQEGFKIRLLATGLDKTFGGENEVFLTDENEVINIPKPGSPIKAIIEAYHHTGRYNSTPYKIEFKVENLTDRSWPIKEKTIEFKDMQEILRNFDTDDGYYCFAKPFITYYKNDKNYSDYYFIKFTPKPGVYEITAKIYSCYRDGAGGKGNVYAG